MENSRAGVGCCRCCFSFILTSGLSALFMWLRLRTSNPVCSIQDFYVPAINITANPNGPGSNRTIYFDLKLDNENKDKGVHYDAVNLTFYYGPNKSLPIANYTAPAFYQGHKKNTRRKAVLETYGVPWEEAFRGVSNSSESSAVVFFGVDLATKLRFKIMAWRTKRHSLIVGATVNVNSAGKKVKKKGIRLKSGAPEPPCYHARLGPLFLLCVLALAFPV